MLLPDHPMVTLTDDQGRAELLNDAFAAKFTQPNVSAPPETLAYDVDALSCFHVLGTVGYTALKSVPANKAAVRAILVLALLSNVQMSW